MPHVESTISTTTSLTSNPNDKIVQGSVRLWHEAGHSKIRAAFDIDDDLQVNFSGHFNPAIEKFECTNARLEYSHINQLTTSRGWIGIIGRDTISLNIDKWHSHFRQAG